MLGSIFGREPICILILWAHDYIPPSGSVGTICNESICYLIIPVCIFAENSFKSTSSRVECVPTPITPISTSPSIPPSPAPTIP